MLLFLYAKLLELSFACMPINFHTTIANMDQLFGQIAWGYVLLFTNLYC